MATRRRHQDSSVVASVERIRTLLGGSSLFYDPDAISPNDYEDSESNWTERDLTSPSLKDIKQYVTRQENSALAAAKEIRKEETLQRLEHIAQQDKDGSLMALYRIWSLIPPVYKYSPQELAEMLARRVLYNQDGIIAISKPYGISTRYSLSEGGRFAVSTALPSLRPLIAPDSDKLHLVHRLDKCTTGLLLLATSQLRASELRDMWAERKIQKKYWALIRNVPQEEEGIIDIPLTRTKISGRYKTIPVVRRGEVLEQHGRVDPPRADIGSLEKKSSVTEYTVLKTGPKCALVECLTRSGFTHQIRCHLGFGLGTPVLGDHKYSDYLGYLPQRLPSELLHLLGIRAAKSRSMPLHLHAREILVPRSDGTHIHIKCRLPKYFVYVLKKLKIPL